MVKLGNKQNSHDEFFAFKENFLQQGGGGVKIPVPGLLKSGIQKISLIYGSIFYQLSRGALKFFY